MEGGEFTFKFVSSLSIWWDKVNAPKVSSYAKSPNWLKLVYYNKFKKCC